MFGVDVYSESSDSIIRDDHAQVVIVKATEGETYVNPKAVHQYELAKSLGKLVGTYHYASGGDPRKEAQFFLDNVRNWVGEAVLAIDWEKYRNSAFGRTDWVRAFVDEVHSETGVWPLVYVSESAIPQVANCSADCGLWVAKYPSMNWNSWTVPDMKVNVAPWGAYTAWQFTGGDMDRDLINVDADGWHKLAKGSGKVEIKPQPAPKPQPQPANTWTDALGDVWHSENGKFTTYEPINLRWGAKTTSAKIATLPAGSTVVYDAWSKHDGWVWIRQPRGNGQFGYMVCRDGSGKPLGKFE